MSDIPATDKKPSWMTGRIRPATNIEFVPEPPVSRRDPFWAIMRQLAEHKDKWAIIATDYKSSDAIRLRQEYPDFEIATRSEDPELKQSDPGWTVYACYRGTDYAKDQVAKRNARRREKAQAAAPKPVPPSPAEGGE